MSINARSADTTVRILSEIIVRDENNTSRAATEGWARDSAIHQIWGGSAGGGSSEPLTVTADPSSVAGAISRASAGPVPTNSTTVTAAGGNAPYSYIWAAQTGWTVQSPTSATTSFVALAVAGGADRSTTFTVTVTDATGATGTNTVDAYVENYGKAF